MKNSVAVRNAMLDAKEATMGTGILLEFFTGAAPANCAAADSGTKLCSMTLPSNYMGDAASGVKSLAGSWAGTGITGGTAAHYRMKDSGGTTCHEQGTVTATGGGGEITLDNVVIAASQPVTITSFTWTAGNA